MVLPNANWSVVGGMGQKDLLSSHTQSTERKQHWLICFPTCAGHSEAEISGFTRMRKTNPLKQTPNEPALQKQNQELFSVHVTPADCHENSPSLTVWLEGLLP